MVKKEEQDRLKKQQQQQKVEERNAILGVQKEWRKRKDEEQKIMSAGEKEMLRGEWEKQTELAKLKERQAIDHQKNTLQTIHHENEKIKLQKEDIIKEEREADRLMIERIVAKEGQLAEYEKVMKEREREEAKRTLAGVKKQGNDMAAYEKELDRLIELERLKKERKAQEDWEKKEKGRISLLHQVYEDRERKVRDHQSERADELRVREQDKV